MAKKLTSPESKFNFDFIGHKMVGFGITFSLVLLTIYSLSTKGLNFGIDFTGGIVIEARFESDVDMQKLRHTLDKEEFGEVTLQAFADPREVMISVQATDDDSQQKKVDAIKTKLNSEYSKIEYRKVDYVGPQVGSELINGSIIAIVLALVAMLVYLWIRFEWQYGVGGILALIHDTILTIGFYSVTQIEFNLTSIAAILTIVGYSINDSVVIYDRIRENFRKYKQMDLSGIINLSVNQTLIRTILTGGTVLLSALALAVVGSDVIYGFAVAMIFGVLIGTHSSIYISATGLIYFRLKR